MNPDLKYWNAINLLPKIGPARFKKLYNYFPTMQQVWQASTFELRQAGLEPKVIEVFNIRRQEISPEAEMEKLARENVKIITIKDKNYPRLLKEIHNPPALLYFKGKSLIKNELALGVVGTRKITQYGRQITPKLVGELTHQNITIVSGLALGIDSLAHQSTLDNNGRTIAVLGSGLDKFNIYPYTNRHLAEKIQERGTVISEYPLGTSPLKQNFPQRNRIISGLAKGVLVIEAPAKSGALITAQFALEQNREVFAIPGNISQNNSAGPNNLIKLGAKLVSSSQDILDELNLTSTTTVPQNKKVVPSSPEEAKLLKHLSTDPIHIDKLVNKSKLETSVASSTLTLMEMRGKVKNLGSMNYIIN